MRTLKLLVLNVSLAVVLAVAAGFIVGRSWSLRSITEEEGLMVGVGTFAVVSLLVFGPAFIAAAILTGLLTALTSRLSKMLNVVVTGIAAGILFPLFQIGGVLLVNGPSVPLIHDATPYIVAALGAGFVFAALSLGLAFRLVNTRQAAAV